MAEKQNGENNAEIQIDIDDLREQLGINALEAENQALRELLSEWLSYMNLIDITVQELTGEPTVTERIKYNIPRGGRVQIQKHRPPIPANLAREKPQLVPKIATEG